jgi:AcrR family transcriptional regulator
MQVGDGPKRRRRRQPEELRREAILAARQILLTDGPSAITLQSVAGALKMAHSNITHHFGTAANLQAALADTLIADLITAVRSGTASLRVGVIREADLVDLVFDTFEQSGSGRLIAWLAAQNSTHLAPLYERFRRLPAELDDAEPGAAVLRRDDLPPIIGSIVITALGSSLIGDGLADSLGLSRTFMRERLTADLVGGRTEAGARQTQPS